MASTPAGVADSVDHGGNLDAARLRFPNAPEPWLDLSTGINPVPYLVGVLPADAWARLPLISDLHALVAAAAARFAVRRPECVVAAPGTQALIQLLPRLYAPTHVAVVGPTYQEHAVCWRRSGHTVEVVPSLADAAGARIVVVVNPDNPTGRLCAPAELCEFALGLDRRGGLLVVDEAFIDVMENETSVTAALAPGIVVLRSFGKVYGLAGLRLGFAVANDGLANKLRAELGPWAVSGPALAIGRAALADGAWLEDTKRRLAADARRLDRLLSSARLDIVGGTPLFRLAAHAKAGEFVLRLGRRGIHVRSFDHAPHWLRFGLPGEEAGWSRLADALRS